MSLLIGDAEVFIHPGIVNAIAILPVGAPARVHVPDDVDKAFLLTRAIRVVVDSKDIAELIEGDFLHVAEAAGVDLKVRTVGITAEQGSVVGVFEMKAFFRSRAKALVADGPVDTSVRTDGEAVHVVTGIGEMGAESVGDGFSGVGLSIVVGVSQFPNIGDDGGINVTFVMKNACGDPTDFVGEIFGVDGSLIGESVPIGVLNEVDSFGERFEICQIVLAVFVVIFDATFVGVAVFGNELLMVEGPLIVGGFKTEVGGNPVAVLPDIEVVGFAPLGLRNVSPALVVEGNGNRVGNRKVGRPFREFQ